MKKVFTLAVAMLCVALCAKAQIIEGKLVDEQNQPLEFANVLLLNAVDSVYIQGTVSDTSGVFRFEKISDKPYILKVSSIGYRTFYTACKAPFSQTLTIHSDAQALGEVVVTAKRPTFELKGSSLVTNIQNTVLSDVGNADDVLQKIPGLRGENGAYTVFGKGTPIIYINNRLVRDNTELSRLDSKDIASVEVDNNPGAEYDATVNAVIRIKTVKRIGDGFGGTAAARFFQHHYAFHNERVDLNYRHNNLDIFGGFTFGNSRYFHKQNEDHYIVADTIWQQNTKVTIKDYDNTIYARGGFNYMINENHSVGATYNYSNNIKSDDKLSSDNNVFANDAYYDNLQISTDIRNNTNNSHSVNVYYSGVFGKLETETDFDFVSKRFASEQDADEQSTEGHSRIVTTSNKQNSDLYAGKFTARYPLWKGTISAGTEASFTKRSDWFYNAQNIMPQTDSEIKERNIAAFASYAVTFNKTTANIGLRYENAKYDYYESGARIDEQSRRYNNLFPNVSVSFPVGKINFSASYTMKTRRPYYNQLRSSLDYIDRFSYEGGNPKLQPETRHDLTLQTSYQWIQASVSYIYIKDFIAYSGRCYEADSSVIIMRNENYDKVQYLDASVTLSPKIGFWEPIFYASFSKQFFKSDNLGKIISFNKPMGYFSLSNTFHLPWQLIGEVEGFYQTAGNVYSDYNDPVYGASLGLRRSFMNKKLTVALNFRDIFDSNKARFFSRMQNMNFIREDITGSRTFRITVTYKFNAASSKYKGTGAAQEEKARL